MCQRTVSTWSHPHLRCGSVKYGKPDLIPTREACASSSQRDGSSCKVACSTRPFQDECYKSDDTRSPRFSPSRSDTSSPLSLAPIPALLSLSLRYQLSSPSHRLRLDLQKAPRSGRKASQRWRSRGPLDVFCATKPWEGWRACVRACVRACGRESSGRVR